MIICTHIYKCSKYSWVNIDGARNLRMKSRLFAALSSRKLWSPRTLSQTKEMCYLKHEAYLVTTPRQPQQCDLHVSIHLRPLRRLINVEKFWPDSQPTVFMTHTIQGLSIPRYLSKWTPFAACNTHLEGTSNHTTSDSTKASYHVSLNFISRASCTRRAMNWKVPWMPWMLSILRCCQRYLEECDNDINQFLSILLSLL